MSSAVDMVDLLDKIRDSAGRGEIKHLIVVGWSESTVDFYWTNSVTALEGMGAISMLDDTFKRLHGGDDATQSGGLGGDDDDAE